MKIKFKTQAYQTAAVDAVLRCFAGQPAAQPQGLGQEANHGLWRQNKLGFIGNQSYKNAEIVLTEAQLLQNVRDVQQQQHLPPDSALIKTPVSSINLDVEMETGTGKTYCYIKTMFELHRCHGWGKFIVVVPSVAIREGVAKALAMTADHFFASHHIKARFFVYDSKQLHELETFSSDTGLQVMVINVQAFNSESKDNRRIRQVLDEFQSRSPIQVISESRPILILDEPQKMEGEKTLRALQDFKPLMVLRYSATHKTAHNKVYRLDALDAYNQKLVKKIAVRGIAVRGLPGGSGYVYVQAIHTHPTQAPQAWLEFEQKRTNGSIQRTLRKVSFGDDLFKLSNELEQYRDRYVITEVNAYNNTLALANGIVLQPGQAVADNTESTLRHIQIREAIQAHLAKEQVLFLQGIKVLSLFFIDEVAKYRDYSQPNEQGEYARFFLEAYQQTVAQLIQQGSLHPSYAQYLQSIPAEKTHCGYFAIDKKTKRYINPHIEKRGDNAGLSNDVDSYNLILKDKERLLSLSEPVRFLFSHSALREGWDNPNVFVICALKHSDNTVSRRQEVGRGLRLCVNQEGERIDNPTTVHDINVLTVVASESYQDFVTALQKDIEATLKTRPREANETFFTGKTLQTPTGPVLVNPTMARQIYQYLLKNDYIDENAQITQTYHQHQQEGCLLPLPEALANYAAPIFGLINTLFYPQQLPSIADESRSKTNPRNTNFYKQEFKTLWQRINHKAAYTVAFDEKELIHKAIVALNHPSTGLHVPALQYTVHHGTQIETTSRDALQSGKAFHNPELTEVNAPYMAYSSATPYDLVGKLAQSTHLTRRVVGHILKGLETHRFDQFKTNPERFLTEVARFINEQKASMVVEHLAYNPIAENYELETIFTINQLGLNTEDAQHVLQRHIYDHIKTDSNTERQFVKELDTCTDVVVYAKLPRGFTIPTPVGDYNPDWAIAFKEGQTKHLYFVAETKGSMQSLELREKEQHKIACARKFFAVLNPSATVDGIKYEVVDGFAQLMSLVKPNPNHNPYTTANNTPNTPDNPPNCTPHAPH